MKHRHLLPNEIDMLVDGDPRFGVAPLHAHTYECDVCRSLLDDARVVADALEALPHFAPASRLADRVMFRVPVFVPALTAARDSLVHWLPQSNSARVAAVTFGTMVAGAQSVTLLWFATRADTVIFVSGMLADRLRGVGAAITRQLALALLGQAAITAIQSLGPVGTSFLFLSVILAGVTAVEAIRRLTAIDVERP